MALRRVTRLAKKSSFSIVWEKVVELENYRDRTKTPPTKAALLFWLESFDPGCALPKLNSMAIDKLLGSFPGCRLKLGTLALRLVYTQPRTNPQRRFRQCSKIRKAGKPAG
jgi:hypothetical protein